MYVMVCCAQAAVNTVVATLQCSVPMARIGRSTYL